MVKILPKFFASMLVVIMLVGTLSLGAAAISYNENVGDSYYNVISQKDWNLAPGILETETVLNNNAGTRRQVMHTLEIDLNNPYVKVIPGTKGMWPQMGNYGTQATSVQALAAEELGYGNVVAATNCSLSWYTEAYYKAHPEYIGEPLGYSILNGEYYENSRRSATGSEYLASGGVETIIVINYDYNPITGEKRPDDMPKAWIRNATDPLTGWEEQAIPVLFTYLVKPDANGNPVNQYPTEDHGGGVAARTFVGIRADGTMVLVVNDGEMAPFSTGFTNHEMADYMIKMGCIIAANCDGGGSTTFCSERPGEDFKVNGGMADGGERPTSNTIIVISTAPADGVFAHASITTDYDYYTPGSTVIFNAAGFDAVGTEVDVPDDVEWTVKETEIGSIDENGVFTSNGTAGTATVQMTQNGSVVGEHTITLAVPDALYFSQPVVTVPFGKTVSVPVKATIHNGLIEVGVDPSAIRFESTNDAIGSFYGLKFTAVDELSASSNLESTVTATLNMGSNPSATVNFKLGKGSVVLWDFEGGQDDVDEWNVTNNRKGTVWDYDLALSLADSTNGQVHSGNYSLRLETNGLHSKASNAGEYAYIRLGHNGEVTVLENARTLGFWLYVPEDNIQCDVRMDYKFDADGDGILEGFNQEVKMLTMETCYYNFDESGWHYLTVDLSEYSKVALQGSQQYKDANGVAGEYFLMIIFNRTKNNPLWQSNGSINGPFTYYFDDFTVDYSEAVDDREEPIFGKMYLDNTTQLVRFTEGNIAFTHSNILNVSATVADATTRPDMTSNGNNSFQLYNISGIDASSARAYIDGVEVNAAYSNGVMSTTGNTVADGYHRIKFEICDNVGNRAVMIRLVNVQSGSDASTLALVPADPTLDKIPFGSIYWMELKANKIETIQSVNAVIDLNNVNHWQLDQMELADGFTATYTTTSETETNTAYISIDRTDYNNESGNAVLARIPVRILNFDDDIKVPGYTAETYWTTYEFYPQDMKMDVDMGVITHVDGSTSTFSNEQFHVDTEMYADKNSIDKIYFNEHGTTHVHTPVALADKDASCAEPGYTGRTFCEECISVVEWGTTIPATGHNFVFENGKQICLECGIEKTVSGLQVIDGKSYFFSFDGKPVSGWVDVDGNETWYYFDVVTFAGADGNKVADNGIKFSFTNGKLDHGTWVTTSDGKRYYYGPSYYRSKGKELTSSTPYEIDGKTYLFNRNGIMQTGLAKFTTPEISGPYPHIYYICDDDGVGTIYSGLVGDYLYVDGIRVISTYTLEECNGDIYYISDGYKVAKNSRIYLVGAVNKFNETHERQLKTGYLEFDEEGKLKVNNGVVGDYLYIDGVRIQTTYTLVEYNGDIYYISDGYKVAKNSRIYLVGAVNKFNETHERQLAYGYFYFDADGKMIFG